MSDLSVEEVNWYEFRYTYISSENSLNIIVEDIADWVNDSGYYYGCMFGIYNDLFIFATNDEKVAMHFKITWIKKNN